jgi:hypothetical protein
MKTVTKTALFLAHFVFWAAGYGLSPELSVSTPSKDPIIERADVVGWPGLCPSTLLYTDAGELIVGWEAGKGDAQPGGAIHFAKSLDLGKTWTSPFLIIKSDNPLMGIGASLYRVPGDPKRMLLCTLEVLWQDVPDQSKPNWASLVGGRKFDTYYSFTTDQGQSSSEQKRLSDPVERKDFPQGPILTLPNGDLLWPWGNWGDSPLNGFRRSTNGGLTWEPVIRAWQDPPPGHDRPLAFNETAAAVCKDGTIVAVARVDGAPGNDKRFWQIKSHDNGLTWTPPRQIEIAGGSPALYCTPQGQLWLAYRDGGYGPGLGLAVSDDNGASWRFLYHLKEPKGEHERLYGHIRYTDDDRKKPWRPAEGMVGYPCFTKISDTQVYVVYHAHNRGELIKQSPDVPFYIAGNLLRIPE